MNRIGIYQCDGKFPNLALMKIAGYHETKGDTVNWYEGALFAEQYEKIYFSKIFDFTPMPQLPANAIIGGTGIDFRNTLPTEIESATPSYSLYPDCKYHLGFSMKGCRLACTFCCVPQKEGRPKSYNSIDEILINPKGGNRLMLLDNDFFGVPNWESNLLRIIELKLKVCFIQGLNIRTPFFKPEHARLLAQVNYTNSKFNQKYLTFAWDKYDDKDRVIAGIKIANEAGIPCNHMQFFILIGYKTTPDQDYERVMFLREKGCMPFVMPYNKENPYQKSFARWVNNRAVFKSATWKDYKYRKSI